MSRPRFRKILFCKCFVLDGVSSKSSFPAHLPIRVKGFLVILIINKDLNLMTHKIFMIKSMYIVTTRLENLVDSPPRLSYQDQIRR